MPATATLSSRSIAWSAPRPQHLRRALRAADLDGDGGVDRESRPGWAYGRCAALEDLVCGQALAAVLAGWRRRTVRRGSIVARGVVKRRLRDRVRCASDSGEPGLDGDCDDGDDRDNDAADCCRETAQAIERSRAPGLDWPPSR